MRAFLRRVWHRKFGRYGKRNSKFLAETNSIAARSFMLYLVQAVLKMKESARLVAKGDTWKQEVVDTFARLPLQEVSDDIKITLVSSTMVYLINNDLDMFAVGGSYKKGYTFTWLVLRQWPSWMQNLLQSKRIPRRARQALQYRAISTIAVDEFLSSRQGDEDDE